MVVHSLGSSCYSVVLLVIRGTVNVKVTGSVLDDVQSLNDEDDQV